MHRLFRTIYAIAGFIFLLNTSHVAHALEVIADIDADGVVKLTPARTVLPQGTASFTVRVRNNALGEATAANDGLKVFFPAANNPWGLARDSDRESPGAAGHTEPVRAAANWPAGVTRYGYKVRFKKDGKFYFLAEGVLVKAATQPVRIVQADANGNRKIHTGADMFRYEITARLKPDEVKAVETSPGTTLKEMQSLTSDFGNNGWTFKQGDGIAGTFHVIHYDAWALTAANLDARKCGRLVGQAAFCFTVEFRAAAAAIANKKLNWLQILCTDAPTVRGGRVCRPGKREKYAYTDAPGGLTGPNRYPLWLAPTEEAGNLVAMAGGMKKLVFKDAPARDLQRDARDVPSDIHWRAHLYLAEVDHPNKIVTLHQGLEWGFEFECGPRVANAGAVTWVGANRDYPGEDMKTIPHSGGPISEECIIRDFGDAPYGMRTGYPSVLAQTGQFPTPLTVDGARTLSPDVRFGKEASLEQSTADAGDPDGEPNLGQNGANRDGADDGAESFNLYVVSIPPPAHMKFNVVSDLTKPMEMYLNVLIDLTGDGKWSGRGAGREPEWVVQNLKTIIAPGNNPLVTPLFAYSDGLRVPPCPWLRAAITDTPASADPNGGWLGTGEFATGEIEDYMLAVFPENCTIAAGPDETTQPPPKLEDPKIPRVDCNPYTKHFGEEAVINFTCRLTNLGKDGTINWSLKRHSGSVSVSPASGATFVTRGDSVDLNFVATRGNLPSSWTAQATDPASQVYSGVIVTGFDESESPFAFTGIEKALYVVSKAGGDVVLLDEFVLKRSETCPWPYYAAKKKGSVTSRTGRALAQPPSDACGFGTMDRLKLHDVYTVTKGRTDSDGDGLDDAVEEELGTDARRADSDNDGILDGNEDHDGDGRVNAVELYEDRTDPLNSEARLQQPTLDQPDGGYPQFGGAADVPRDNGVLDIAAVRMSAGRAADVVDVQLTFNGLFAVADDEEGLRAADYRILLNTDNRMDTGVHVNGLAGIDHEIVVGVRSSHTDGRPTVVAYDLNTNTKVLAPLGEPSLERTGEFGTQSRISLRFSQSDLAVKSFLVPAHVLSHAAGSPAPADRLSLVFDRAYNLDGGQSARSEPGPGGLMRTAIIFLLIGALFLLGVGALIGRAASRRQKAVNP